MKLTMYFIYSIFMYYILHSITFTEPYFILDVDLAFTFTCCFYAPPKRRRKKEEDNPEDFESSSKKSRTENDELNFETSSQIPPQSLRRSERLRAAAQANNPTEVVNPIEPEPMEGVEASSSENVQPIQPAQVAEPAQPSQPAQGPQPPLLAQAPQAPRPPQLPQPPQLANPANCTNEEVTLEEALAEYSNDTETKCWALTYWNGVGKIIKPKYIDGVATFEDIYTGPPLSAGPSGTQGEQPQPDSDNEQPQSDSNEQVQPNTNDEQTQSTTKSEQGSLVDASIEAQAEQLPDYGWGEED